MRLNLLKAYCRTLVFLIILLPISAPSLLHSAMEWGWRQNLNVDVRTGEKSLKIIGTHNQHYAMYTLETRISPYVQYSGHLTNIGHPANICMGAITLLVQCSSDLVYSITIPIQNKNNEKIIFCSQKAADLHGSFPLTETLSFSPKDSHPKNEVLQSFLETLSHPKFASYDSQHSALKKSRKEEGTLNEERKAAEVSNKKRPSNASSEGGGPSVASSGGFGMKFQHTEQKLVYYLLQNRGNHLHDHIHRALNILSPAITDIPSYYNNIVGIILHVHTRLDVCENCNDSLVLFRKNALTILNTPPEGYISSEEEHIERDSTTEGAKGIAVKEREKFATASALSRSIVPAFPTIKAPVLVTVSSRARNDTNREITGYDEHWERDIDHKNHGHINIQLRSEGEIRRLALREDLGGVEGIEIIDINAVSTIKKAASSAERVVDYTHPSPNCHGIFTDVLQRFVFK